MTIPNPVNAPRPEQLGAGNSPKPPIPERAWFKPTMMIGGGLVVGMMLGTASAGDADIALKTDLATSQARVESLTAENARLTSELKDARVDRPEFTQQESAPTTAPEVKTVEKVVEKTPTTCITALDDAERIIQLAATVIGKSSEGMAAAASFDIAGMESVTKWMGKQTPKMEGMILNYNRTSAKCREAAQ